MANKSKKTYRSYHPLRTFIVALIAAILILIMIAVAIFFGFQKYIVYTPDGVRLDIPWLNEGSPIVTTVPQ